MCVLDVMWRNVRWRGVLGCKRTLKIRRLVSRRMLERHDTVKNRRKRSEFCFHLKPLNQYKSPGTAWMRDVEPDILILNCWISWDQQNSLPRQPDEVMKICHACLNPFLLVSCVIMMLSNSSPVHGLSVRIYKQAQARWEMKALVLVIMYKLGFAFPLPRWPFCYKRLEGMSFQIHDQAKQKSTLAYAVFLSFILMKQRLLREKDSVVNLDAYWSC